MHPSLCKSCFIFWWRTFLFLSSMFLSSCLNRGRRYRSLNLWVESGTERRKCEIRWANAGNEKRFRGRRSLPLVMLQHLSDFVPNLFITLTRFLNGSGREEGTKKQIKSLKDQFWESEKRIIREQQGVNELVSLYFPCLLLPFHSLISTLVSY